MRDIKFRAWDSVSGNISPAFSLFGEFTLLGAVFAWLSHVRGVEGGECGLKDLNSIEIMQFTGLKDSEGADIYEGDIIKFTYWWFDGNEAESTLTGGIVYSDYSMSFQLKGVKNKEWEQHTGCLNDTEYLTPFSELTFEEADFLVVGNIYENPNMLTANL